MVAFLDRLQTAKRLGEAGFAEPQAEVLTDLLRDAQEAGQAQLATKADLGEVYVKRSAARGKIFWVRGKSQRQEGDKCRICSYDWLL